MEDFNFTTFLAIAWRCKKRIIAAFVIVSSLAVLLALSMNNIYKSEVVLVPSVESSKSIGSRIGGLAALAGVNVNDGDSNKVVIAVETLKSKDFLYRFVEKHNYLPSIMAIDSWDSGGNTIKFNDKSYDSASNTWVRKAQFPKSNKPSDFELAEFLEKKYSVVQDKINGTIRISFEHNSPYLAKEWLEKIVIEINEHMRQRDIEESNKFLKYLEKEMLETKNEQMRNSLASLIEEQLKIKMLAEVRVEYVFKILDPAYFPVTKDKPKRAIIVIMLSFFGTLFFTLIIVLLNYKK